MPGPYGSLSNPAELDFFQQIVGVHWNAEKYIAFPLRIQRRSVVKDYPHPAQAIGEVGQTDQPVDWTSDAEDAPLPSTGSGHDFENYVTGFQYEYGADATPGAGYGGYGRLTAGGWTPRTIDSFEGLPSLPDVRSVASWSVIFLVLGTPETVLSWWPRAEYQAVAGTPIDGFSVPGHTDIPFVGATSATLQMRGIAYTAGPLQGTTDDTARTPYTTEFRHAKYGTAAPFNVGTEEGIDHVFETLTVNVSSIRIVRNGHTYAAIGAALVPNLSPAPSTPGELWILCERESTTS